MVKLFAKGVSKDRTWFSITLFCSFVILLIVVSIFGILIFRSIPVIREQGILSLLLDLRWEPTKHHYGVVIPLLGTFLTSIISIAIAFPLGVGTAIFLVEICPNCFKTVIGVLIELLAGVPSIVYGFWGLMTLSKFSQEYLQDPISNTLGKLPFIGLWFSSDQPLGASVFLSGLILSTMILPLIASFSRDAFMSVSEMQKESAYSLGATKWETFVDVVWPFSRKVIWAGTVIALGRALGETMAVAFVIGNSYNLPNSIFSPFTTITALITSEFKEAEGIHLSALLFLALLLLVINTLVISLSKIYVKYGGRK